jgi:dolichol-phosphate mannosyltransferase
MSSTQDRGASVRKARASLILPISPGSSVPVRVATEYRNILEGEAGLQSVEVIISHCRDNDLRNGQPKEPHLQDSFGDLATFVTAEASEWPGLVRAGLSAATGDHLIVLDVSRHYAPESLVRVLEPVRTGQYDLAVGVPRGGGRGLWRSVRSGLGIGVISRLLLGTSDVFSGLFALRRGIWDAEKSYAPAVGSSLVLDSLLRHHARCVDVPVEVDNRFQSGRVGFKDLRPLKHLLDGRFGNYSRLVQFCMVGASGMVVDLSFYALLQLLLSFTWLAARQSAFFGCSWHLAISAALSIAIALVWNFTLNRRLTFNDAHKGALLRQFFTYVLSNALAIALSFSVRLYLPAHVGFFARHRLAAAVVGIVAATAISFSMARWLVFARRPELKRSAHFPLEPSTISQPSGVR